MQVIRGMRFAARLRGSLLCWLVVGVTGCGTLPDRAETTASGPQSGLTVEAFAREVVAQLADRRVAELAKEAHPQKGVLFSPYGYIDVTTAVTLSGQHLEAAWRVDSPFTWGVEDGSGEPIVSSIRDYFDSFVYDVDYRNADLVSVNQRVSQGNSLLNIAAVFPQAQFVEFHFKGFSPRYQGMDWRSLFVVVEAKPGGDGWWLLAIVNDRWTI